MRKFTMVSVLLICVIVLIPLAAIGLRDVLLSQTDCQVCRVIFSLARQPSDYNAPIAISRLEKGVSRFNLFPKYVGPYFIEIYGASSNSEVAAVNFSCSEQIRFIKVQGENGRNKVLSNFGSGFTVGGLYILPKQTATKDRIACDIKVTSAESLLLVITRASEL